MDKENKPRELELGNGNSVLVVSCDGKIQRHEYPGCGSRAGFLAKFIRFPVLGDGTSPETEQLLENNKIIYNEESKLWISKEDKKKIVLNNLTIINNLIPENNLNRPGSKIKKVKAIVIHYVEASNQDPKDTIAYWTKAVRKGSAHYVISTTGIIYQAIPEDEYARHAGTTKIEDYTSIAKKIFGDGGINPNYYSIGIEMVNIDSSGRFTDKTVNATIELASKLLKKYGLNPDEHLIRHYDVTGKKCPLFYVNNPKEWEKFKDKVKEKMK